MLAVSVDEMKTLSAEPPADSDEVSAALNAIYNWNYRSDVEELRTLYAKGLNLQWIAPRDLPCDLEAVLNRRDATR